jgi:hypothetical protein
MGKKSINIIESPEIKAEKTRIATLNYCTCTAIIRNTKTEKHNDSWEPDAVKVASPVLGGGNCSDTISLLTKLLVISTQSGELIR